MYSLLDYVPYPHRPSDNKYWMVKIRTERLATAVSEIAPLAQAHWEEVNVFDVPLDIDWNQYLKLDQVGRYNLTTVRISERLVGWLGFFVYPHLRHQNLLLAREDWYYVVPDSRSQGLGRKLFTHAELNLRDHGVDRIMVSCKVHQDHTGLLESLGYQHYEKNFTKALD
jgi:GNAT superfamily N-acetyltransferase